MRAILLVLILVSCKVQMPVTSADGVVISTDGDEVFVAFEVVSGGKADAAFNWFHCPGNSYVRGDKYPDPKKYEKR